jgi:hypothetical protein
VSPIAELKVVATKETAAATIAPAMIAGQSTTDETAKPGFAKAGAST